MPRIEQLLGTRTPAYYEARDSPSFFDGTWVCVGQVLINGLKDEETARAGKTRFVLPNTKLAEFLLKVHQAIGHLGDTTRRLQLCRLVAMFEESIGDPDGVREMKRFYEDQPKNVADLVPQKLCLDALKSTTGKEFDTSAWSRKEGDEE